MTYKQPGRQGLVSRVLAAVVLTSIYAFSLVGATALITGVSTTSASAQRGDWGRGRGRGYRGGRGYGRGYGRGRGYGGPVRGRGRGACVVNAAGVRICL
ncbi:hypothetical protein NML43_02035 [Rhodopseudomonas palustris]|uniref:hypothetical protein n=1 Tax=Rhodopseudomonas TaxID=1073 RepID=UPI0006B9DE58|nr:MULTISPECIES: hypothetical protein [Rhodopseudomonas]KPF98979.1 hypothetical protein IP86_10370 [Rhodopseudomonas sp. AAP120]MCP9625861.1 hypothetical protein [Rhodopseudomonas palustris]